MPENELVVAFGKIFYVSTHKSVPPLSEMSLLFLKSQSGNFSYRAACIDLEIDACGNSQKEAWENLKKSLMMYIGMAIEAQNGSITGAAKAITKESFSESDQKEKYFNLYRKAKLEYTIQAIDAGKLDLVKKEKLRQKQLKTEKEPILFFVEELQAA